MRDINGRQAQLFMQMSNDTSHIAAHSRIQMGQRLIHDRHVRITYQSTCNRYTLFLSAGQSRRLHIQNIGQAEFFGNIHYLLFDLLGRFLMNLQRICDIIVNREIRTFVSESKR